MKFLPLAAKAGAIAAAFASTSLIAQDVDLTTDNGKVGYSMGANIGMNIMTQMPLEDIDLNALVMGISDAIGGDLQMSEEEMMASIQAFAAEQQAKMQLQVEAQAQAGLDFLTTNGERPEVTTTASGLQYEVLEEGAAGGTSPLASDTVSVHYHGTLIDGTVFDSSVQRGTPAEFVLNQVISGWTEGVQLMSEGDKYRFYIPPELAYGASGAGQVIGPNTTLIFDVELLEVK